MNRPAETIPPDLNVKASRLKYLMDQILKPRAINVKQLVGNNNLDISHEKSWIMLRMGKATCNISASHADLMQHVAVGGNKRIVGFTAKDIDGAARYIFIIAFMSE